MSSKGKGKGKKGKKKGKNTGQVPSEVQRTHTPTEGELFGIIIKILGGNHLEVMGDDGKRRVVRIPGKMNRRRWVKSGDLVLIEPWYGMDEDKKADLTYVYKKNEYRGLFRSPKLRERLEKLGVEPPQQMEVYE